MSVTVLVASPYSSWSTVTSPSGVTCGANGLCLLVELTCAERFFYALYFFVYAGFLAGIVSSACLALIKVGLTSNA
eukprot:5786980-Pyramimonas_sp.AAC.1